MPTQVITMQHGWDQVTLCRECYDLLSCVKDERGKVLHRTDHPVFGTSPNQHHYSTVSRKWHQGSCEVRCGPQCEARAKRHLYEAQEKEPHNEKA